MDYISYSTFVDCPSGRRCSFKKPYTRSQPPQLPHPAPVACLSSDNSRARRSLLLRYPRGRRTISLQFRPTGPRTQRGSSSDRRGSHHHPHRTNLVLVAAGLPPVQSFLTGPPPCMPHPRQCCHWDLWRCLGLLLLLLTPQPLWLVDDVERMTIAACTRSGACCSSQQSQLDWAGNQVSREG